MNHIIIGNTLYIFIDESGNFDFSPTGTNYWILTAVTTRNPLVDRTPLFELRYQLLQKGIDQECFHATEDKQAVRDAMYTHLKSLSDFEIDAVLVQKNKTDPSLYRDSVVSKKGKPKHFGEGVYQKVAEMLLQNIFERYQNKEDVDRIVVVLGALFTRNKREFIKKYLKKSLKQKFHKPSYIYFHRAEADINCQIADYCGWAVYRKSEDGEERPWQEVENKVKNVFGIFQSEKKEYY